MVALAVVEAVASSGRQPVGHRFDVERSNSRAGGEQHVGAAGILGLTGPAVTLQLQQLEAELGVVLFDRLSDGLRPTSAGKAVIEAAEAIEERLRILEDEIEAIAHGRRGSLKLGVVSTAKYFAPRLMAAFLKHHPDIQLELRVGNREETIAALAEHRPDIALMGRRRATCQSTR